MGILLTLLLLTFVEVDIVICETDAFSFTAVGPLQITPNDELVIVTIVHSLKQNEKANFVFTLTNNDETVATKACTFQEIGKQDVALTVGNLSHDWYNLTTKVVSGDYAYEEVVNIEKETVTKAIFIQTDKTIYKPGDIVKFRIFLLNKFSQPLSAHKDAIVTVYDSHGNVIKSWPEEAPLFIQKGKGFASTEFLLSSELNLGDWTIEAQDTERQATISRHQFSVEEHIHQKFRVKLSFTPSFVWVNDTEISVRIEAVTMFGKKLDSVCSVTLKNPNEYCWNGNQSEITKISNTTNAVSDIQFDIKEVFDSNTIIRAPRPFTIVGTCKDMFTGVTRNETSTIWIHSIPYEVELIDKPKRIYSGVPFNLTFNITNLDGNPIEGGENAALKLEFKYHATDISAFKTVKTSVPSNGIAELHINLPAFNDLNPNSVWVIFSYKSIRIIDWLDVGFNPTVDTHVFVKLKTPESQIREEECFEISIKSTQRMVSVSTMIVVLGGTILHSEFIKLPKASSLNYDLNITLPLKSSPKATLLLLMRYANGKDITESLYLDVKQSKAHELIIAVSNQTSLPGQNVTISLTGSKPPGQRTYFGLRIVDQFLQIMKESNENLMQQKITDAFQHFRILRGPPSWLHGPENCENFSGANLFFVHNGAEISCRHQTTLQKFGLRSVTKNPGNSQEVKVRSHFPETWIWEDGESSNGQLNLSRILPDTITSWHITAFQIDGNGIRLSTNLPKLTSSRPFFIVVNLPYSVSVGEVFRLQISVHNYLPKSITANVTLHKEGEWFKFPEGNVVENSVTKATQIGPDSVASVSFLISPLSFGHMPINVKAVTTESESEDAVKKTLYVKPSGIQQVHNKAEFVNLLSSSSYNKKNATGFFPKDRVVNADSFKISVLGDILGGVMKHFDKVLDLPGGCGEQKLLPLALSVSVLDYLNATMSVKKRVYNSAIKRLELGYQNQFAFMGLDGSFSPFAGSPSEGGSTWLTAFVTRLFVQAKKYIFIDLGTIKKSLQFLISKQNKNGSFSESGFSYNKHLRGHNTQSQMALTAYTLLTFAEAEKCGIDIMKLMPVESEVNVMEEGVNFLQKNIKAIYKDEYSANLVSYFLHFVNSSMKESVFNVTKSHAIEKEDGTIHWEDITKQFPPAGWWEDNGTDRPNAKAVETTGYGLISYLHRGEFKDSIKIAKWLLSKANSRGGFSTTQDTVVGLTALAKFAVALQSNTDINIRLKWKNGSHNFKITSKNRMEIQEFILPTNVREVDIKAEGKGSAVAQISWTYYVQDAGNGDSFSLTAKVTDEDNGRNLNMKICAFYKLKGTSNMAIIEANTPSGYAFDQEDLIKLIGNSEFRRYELKNKDSHVNLYFDGFSSKKQCLNLKAYRLFVVAKHQPGIVKVYDYYDVTKKSTVLYKVPKIPLCDICLKGSACALEECKTGVQYVTV